MNHFKILVAEDEPDIFEEIQWQLRKRFLIDNVRGRREVAVVSDIRAPKINGVPSRKKAIVEVGKQFCYGLKCIAR